MPKVDGLTDKQQRFAEEYLIDLNATQAAIRAGYSEKTSGAIGRENLQKPIIQESIRIRIDEVTRGLGLTQQDVINGLLKEAEFEGKGALHSARVTAWSWLGRYF